MPVLPGQWALPAPLLPAAGSSGGRGGRPEKWRRRLVLDAIFYLVRGGIAWRVLPAGFPPHRTVQRPVPPVDPRAGVVPDLRSAA
ncbi:transposase [Streptomyces sp. NPDC048483]|uniref:transposase n=1 Tax=Streptomyces sp. NPDC048483 TaxID=3154927 RepID=UPI00341DF58C